MSEEKHYEEKDEKELYKHDEKAEEGDVLSSIAWAFILIWAGFVFLASNMGWFSRIGLELGRYWNFSNIRSLSDLGVWNMIALGAGVILVFESLVRLLLPNFRRNIGGSLITAVIFIGLGLGGWHSWTYLWPLILIAVGVSILVSGIFRKK